MAALSPSPFARAWLHLAPFFCQNMAAFSPIQPEHSCIEPLVFQSIAAFSPSFSGAWLHSAPPFCQSMAAFSPFFCQNMAAFSPIQPEHSCIEPLVFQSIAAFSPSFSRAWLHSAPPFCQGTGAFSPLFASAWLHLAPFLPEHGCI